MVYHEFEEPENKPLSSVCKAPTPEYHQYAFVVVLSQKHESVLDLRSPVAFLRIRPESQHLLPFQIKLSASESNV